MLEEERKLVLNMLAEGKITAEQASELLRALGEAVTPEEIHNDMPPGSVSESMREALQKARQAAREAAQVAREEARKAREMARKAAQEVRGQARGFEVDFGGLGTFIDGLVSKISGEFGSLGHRWDDTYDGSFGAGPVELDLATNNGSIHCHTWSLSTYKLILHVRAGGADEAEARRRTAEAIKLEHGPAGITVKVEDGWTPRVAVAVELYLPEGLEYRLKGNTGNGSIHLESGHFAVARLRTGNGSINNKATVGDLEAHTGNGSIHAAARGGGHWTLGTGNGSVHVDTTELGDTAVEVHASTGAGRVNIDIPGANKSLSGLGQLELHLSTPNFEQAASRLSLRARTGLGSITVRSGA